MSHKTFYVFRHGETDWNAQGLFQGHTDIPLNGAGIEQAKNLANTLQLLAPEIIFCSDLTRAMQTARFANQNLMKPILVSHKIREINIGALEGIHRDEVRKQLGESGWQKWISKDENDLDFRFPRGESKRDVFERCIKFLKIVAENFEYQKIAISTHGGVIKRIMHGIADLRDDEVPIKNCCLYEIKYDLHTGRWQFIGLKN